MAEAFNDALDIFSDPAPVVQRKRVESGTYVARLYGIADLGTQPKTDGKTGKSYVERILKLSFELPTELSDFGKGKLEPATVHDQFVRFELKPNSKSQRLTLFKYAQALCGITADTIAGFRVDSMLGQACSLTVESDGEYDNIVGISALAKGMTAPAQLNPTLKYSVLADGFQSDEFKALNKGARRAITKSLEFQSWAKSNAAEAAAIMADCAKQG